MKRKMSTMLAALTAAAFIFTGCGKKEAAPAPEPGPAEQETELDETAEPESAAQPEESTQEKIEDAAILVVSFGTSYNDSRDITIGAVEEAVSGV